MGGGDPGRYVGIENAPGTATGYPVRRIDAVHLRAEKIRACLEAELLTDVQQRMALLSRDMDNQNGQRIPYQPALSRG